MTIVSPKPIDNGEASKELFTIRRSKTREYSVDEVCVLLEMAEDLGISLGPDSQLAGLSIDEVDSLVHSMMRPLT